MSIIRNILFYLTIGVAVVDWIAADRQWKVVRFITKPLTLVLLILWFTQYGRWQGVLLWFGIGLVVSLVGDILLLFPAKLFLGGLIAFLLAHTAYIIGFNTSVPPIGSESLFVLLGVTVIGAIILRVILRGMNPNPQHTRMRIPVIAYCIVISLMLVSALLTFFRSDWNLPSALLVSIGATLFFASDAMIAIRDFVHRFTHDDYLVMATYHLGQILLTAGVLMNYVRQ
jgi:alkenylglycerophosphocholine/alkenylglycerophosphoethanolamine hydrolase